MRKSFLCFSVLICLLLFSGCTRSSQMFAMDTVITMELNGIHAEKALELAEAELLRLEQLLSVSAKDSEIKALNDHKTRDVSAETADLIRAAQSVSALTGGAYDCTIKPVVDVWGWHDDPAVPSDAALQDALAKVGSAYLSIDDQTVCFAYDDMGIDLGGIAKGYSAGKLYELLEKNGIRSGILSLGGNIRAIGKKPNGQPWVVGIADPAQPSSYLCTVSVEDTAVVTSGDYQRCFTANGVDYHHILDPQSGMPAENGLHSVTIVCTDDTLADGLSTALFVMGMEDAVSFWRSDACSFEAVFISDTGIFITEGLETRFSCQTDYEVISR